MRPSPDFEEAPRGDSNLDGLRVPGALCGEDRPVRLSVLQALRGLRPLLEPAPGEKPAPDSLEARKLLAAERALQRKLAHPLSAELGSAPVPRDAALSFLRAYLFSGLFSRTVGRPGTALSSLSLRTLPLFTPPSWSAAARRRTFRSLCRRLNIHPEDRAQIERDYEAAKVRLQARTALTSALKEHLRLVGRASPPAQKNSAIGGVGVPTRPTRTAGVPPVLGAHNRRDAGGTVSPTSESIFALFGRLFPGHPLLPGEVDLVATDSAFYFYIMSENNFIRRPSFKARAPRERRKVREYLRRMRDFRFENFSHFPMFGFFDARAADPALIGELLERVGPVVGRAYPAARTALTASGRDARPTGRAGLCEMLDSIVTVTESESLEKYLIHDTWGHVWQGDLTDLKQLFAWMADLQYPLSPDHTLSLAHDKLAFADLFFLNASGECEFDPQLAGTYIDGLLRERAHLFLAPVCAELCADIIEYYYSADHPEPPGQGLAGTQADHTLPSSSLFSNRPAKLDFAWADMCYFVSALTGPNLRYLQEPALRRNFVQRLRTLLETRFPHAAAANAKKSRTALERQITRHVAAFFERYAELQEARFNTRLDIGLENGRPAVNLFFTLFHQLLRVQATVNRCIRDCVDIKAAKAAGGEGRDPKDRATLAIHRMVLVFFIIHYFERNPLQNFLGLAEALGRFAPGFLKLLREVESAATVAGTEARPAKVKKTAGRTPAGVDSIVHVEFARQAGSRPAAGEKGKR